MLLWSEGAHPLGTRDWLRLRPWLSAHIHLRMPGRMVRHRTEAKVEAAYTRAGDLDTDIHSDFSRIARGLMGTSIGLVLGGGGARGAAHLGMLRAIVEAGIPVDKVGGVSIGAFMTALWALHRDLATTSQKTMAWFEVTIDRTVLDITFITISVHAKEVKPYGSHLPNY